MTSKHHPIRGGFGGFFLGVAVSLFLLIFSVWPVKSYVPYAIVVGGCLVLGVLWGFVAPARRGPIKGAPPVQHV